ncbi:zeta toxin [Leptospira wolffii]|uniref:Zeta toxin n=1 Tax=Leptospira wolffii TaxID=409998 RepID=A0A2M9ZAN4_9LEPT|nr:zeta toxin family protein [Leptospira wolffii]PJZ65479.1 zeta toxin [Leptospira wolffii]
MAKARLRIFAGPNGSGKTTFIQKFSTIGENIKLGVYINADDIEASLKKNSALDFSAYKISISTEDIQKYFMESQFSPIKTGQPDLWKSFLYRDGYLEVNKNQEIDSYIAADLAEFLREEILKRKISFSFETVMSDSRKVDFMQFARSKGYTIYLYYFCTEDPAININRVQNRVGQMGHAVSEEKILNRYKKSLNNLRDAVLASDRAYLFDSTEEYAYLFSEITDGKHVRILDPGKVPNWFSDHLGPGK